MAGKKRSAEDDEEAFPRGGSQALTPLEKRQLEQQAKADLAQEQQEDVSGNSKGKRVKRSHHEDDQEGKFFKQAQTQGKVDSYVELLKFRHLSVGMMLWGVVLEVSPRGLVITLPQGLRGHVKPAEASDVLHHLLDPTSKKGAALRQTLPGGVVPDLTQLFAVGQFVRCCVTDLRSGGADDATDAQQDQQPQQTKKGQAGKGGKPRKKGKHVELTLRLRSVCGGVGPDAIKPGQVLPACIRSVEDHGYIITFGIKSTSGFLPKKEVAAIYGPDAQLLPGQLIEAVVKAAPSNRQVQVSIEPEAVANSQLQEWDGLNLSALLPGSLVTARVRAVLKDGLTVSFMTYFHGTIDLYHLAEPIPAENWKSQYHIGQKLRARILYVDPINKKAGLSLCNHLVSLQLPTAVPRLGQVFDDAVIKRIDPGLGLLLQLPLQPTPGAAFAHVSNISDGDRVDKLEKRFKVGESVRARVVGFRLLDGLSVVSLKESVIKRQLFSFDELHTGQVLEPTVAAVLDGGLLLSLSSSQKAFVPNLHVSDLGTKKAAAKFKVDQKVVGRILMLDPVEKKVTMTLKPSLLGSKLPILSDYAAATPGMKAHGVISNVNNDHGLFIAFYGGVSGLIGVQELGLVPRQTPSDVYQVGQVLRCQVLTADPVRKRLRLTLVGKKNSTAGTELQPASLATAAGSVPWGGLSPGDVIQSATVKGVEETKNGQVFVLDVIGPAGTHVDVCCEQQHLSDHPAGATALAAALQSGMSLGPLMVLCETSYTPISQKDASGKGKQAGKKHCLLVTRKPCMVSAAHLMPKSVSDIKEGTHLPGYVHGVTSDAVYVRFTDHVDGRCGLAQMADVLVTDPARHFHVGQSVRCAVVQTDEAKGRFFVSLKPSVVGQHNGAILDCLFRDLEFAYSLSLDKAATDPVEWSAAFAPGTVVDGAVHEIKDYGLVCDLAAHEDVVGLVTTEHGGEGTHAEGEQIKAVVLDVNKTDGIVDLSILPDLTAAHVNGQDHDSGDSTISHEAAATTDIKVGERLSCVVQLLKDDYVVVSLPDHKHAIGYVSRLDYNLQGEANANQAPWQQGQRLTVVGSALPDDENGGRLILAYEAPFKGLRHKGTAGGAADGGGKLPHGLVEATIKGTDALGLDVTFGKGISGRIHISELQEPLQQPPAQDPLKRYSHDQMVLAAVMGHVHGVARSKSKDLELTLRPAAVAAAQKGEKVKPALSLKTLTPGTTVVGWVQDVTEDGLWLTLGPALLGRVHMFEAVNSTQELATFQSRFKEGQAVAAKVLHVDARRHMLDLTLRDVAYSLPQTNGMAAAGDAEGGKAQGRKTAGSAGNSSRPLPVPGSLMLGKVKACSGAGVLIQLGAGVGAMGHVALTDIHDTWVSNALAGIPVGAFVRAKVLEAQLDGLGRLPLSLRASEGGVIDSYTLQPAVSADGSVTNKPVAAPAGVLNTSQLDQNAAVHGYVRHVSKKGMFVWLDREHHARVKLANMSDGFIEDPAAAFPEGMFVSGRLLTAPGTATTCAGSDADHLEMTLRSAKKEGVRQLADFEEGDITTGKVRRVEKYGVFIELARSNVVGLAHISEVASGVIRDLAKRYQQGQVVRARILAIDRQAGKVSLGLKPEYVESGVEEEQEGDGLEGGHGMKDLDEEMVDVLDHDHDDVDDEDEDDEVDEVDEVDTDDMELDEVHQLHQHAEDDDDDVHDSEDNGEDDGEDDDDDEQEEEEEEEGGSAGSGDIDAVDEEADDEDDLDQSKDVDDDDLEAAAADAHQEEEEVLRSPGNLLHLSAGPTWGELQLDDDQQGKQDQNGDGDGSAKKLSKAAKKRVKADKEAAIRVAELARLSGHQAPQSTADFERLVLSSPNSSFLWIKYMAFLISLSELDKARSVAERALTTINFRHQDEKFNMWVAWLNLENAYGTPPEEAVMALFQKALQYTDPKKMYLALLGILERSKREELCQQVLRTMTRKFSSSAKIWCRAIEHTLQCGQDGAGEAARKLLERALSALPLRKHTKVITSTALLEFRHGSAERGRSMFEGVLRNYPKRLDLWGVYVDQEIKQGDPSRVRSLFERATSLSLPPKKMKFFFRRWLEYEQTHGNAAAVEDVKRRAMEYVEQHSLAT